MQGCVLTLSATRQKSCEVLDHSMDCSEHLECKCIHNTCFLLEYYNNHIMSINLYRKSINSSNHLSDTTEDTHLSMINNISFFFLCVIHLSWHAYFCTPFLHFVHFQTLTIIVRKQGGAEFGKKNEHIQQRKCVWVMASFLQCLFSVNLVFMVKLQTYCSAPNLFKADTAGHSVYDPAVLRTPDNTLS